MPSNSAPRARRMRRVDLMFACMHVHVYIHIDVFYMFFYTCVGMLAFLINQQKAW